MQAKRSPSFAEVAIDKLSATLVEILDLAKSIDDFSASYNEQLVEAVSLFRESFLVNASSFPTVDVSIVYGTRGFEIHPKVARKAEALRARVADMFSDSMCQFRFITPRDLVVMARRQRPTSYDLAANEVMSIASDGLIATAKLGDYYDFVTNDAGELRQSLLESNVRDYEGPGGINASIRATLEEGGDDDFWWLNNGVTVVARRVAQFGKKLTLEYPQIVNGLQTTREVWGYCRGGSPRDDHRSLLIRIVVPPNEASRDRIIRATNSQTAIPTVALRATDPVQRSIEEYFSQHGYFYERRKNQHQVPGRPVARVCSIAYMAECVLAVHLLEPHIGAPRLGGRFLRDDKEYGGIFSAATPLEIFFRCFQLTRAVELTIRGSRSWSSRRGSPGRTVLLIAGVVSAEWRQEHSLSDLSQEMMDRLDITGWHDRVRAIEDSIRAEGRRRQSDRDGALRSRVNAIFPSMFKSANAAVKKRDQLHNAAGDASAASAYG